MLEKLLADIRSNDKDTHRQAATALGKLARSGTLSLADAQTLLRAAASGDWPTTEHTWEDASAQLVHAARDIAKDKQPDALLPLLDECTPRMTLPARVAALHLPVLSTSPQAVAVYLRCLRTLAGKNTDLPIMTFPVSAGPQVARALFPAALELARDPALAYPLFANLLEFRNADLLPADIAKPFHTSMTNVLTAELARARALQRTTGLGWRDEAPYDIHRSMIGLMFDLAGVLSSKSLLSTTHSASDLVDPRLRRFRAVSLLRNNVNVSDEELAWIALSPPDRWWLFRQLHDIKCPQRLPPACRDQAKLAEGNMADWLTFGTELGREPDEIELIHVETRNASQGPRLMRWLSKREPVDYYFFKFRVTEEHWSQENGWMVGMAGGYARAAQPTTDHDGGTFSKFDSLESKSIKEHVAEYLS
ncbi:MAG TPA: hypothetical protein VK157_08300 [Phycisphaerales bacterium]|nr:hypothetical protein [Phycisphaerales bacterium]